MAHFKKILVRLISSIVIYPGIVVMGDDSCSRAHGFESRSHKLDEH